jgi:hypothetical protein
MARNIIVVLAPERANAHQPRSSNIEPALLRSGNATFTIRYISFLRSEEIFPGARL